MRNYLIKFRYDGSNYAGYQRQKNANTVGEEIFKALCTLFGSVHKLSGCSRTDSGVHALGYCASFCAEKEIEPKRVIRSLNGILPEDIGVYFCEYVPEDFHARYSVKSKEYIYKIWNSPERNPFYEKYALHFPFHIDEKMLTEECKAFIGKHDFSSFCASGSSVEDNVRTVESASFERDGDIVIFRVRGDGFLYNMVRIMVGTCLDIVREKIPEGEIGNIIEKKDRSCAGITAPAHGLYLNEVFY